MNSITRAACIAALTLLVLPQAAFGLTKPAVIAHRDTAPVDARASAIDADLGAAGSIGSGGGSSGTNSISFSSLVDGDIIVVLDKSSVTGHSGLFDDSHYNGILSYAVLSANVSPVSGVQYEKCAKYRLYDRAYALRVASASSSTRLSARRFAARQLGKPYSVFASKGDLRSYYCSKLSWAAYEYASGVDLDHDGGFWVWPVDLLNSRHTTLVGSWS